MARREAGPQTPFDRMVLAGDEHDRRLVANTHPPDWVNPTPVGRYNLVVVGAGTAGLVSAGAAALFGAKVALVERALMGGDCLNVGCVPSKGVVRAARAAHDARAAADFGARVEASGVDFGAAMERVRRVRARLSPNDSARRFAEMGVDVFLGEARFVARDAIEVGGARLEFARAIVATGARPAEPDVPGLAETGFLTNETVFTLTELPPRLAVLGGGPLGCELAQAFGRLGGEVTLVTDGPRIMPKEDPDAAEVVCRALERDGVRVVTGARATAARREGTARVLGVELAGGAEELVCDAILVAVGRRPNVEGLGLEAAGVRSSPHGVEVDDFLRTSNRRVFAAGDVCSRFKFTHAADAMARLALKNAFFPYAGRERVSRLVIPWCTYTDPEVAHVGLSAEEAARAGRAVRTITEQLADVDRAVLDGEEEGFARVHCDARSGRLLGATVVARHAGEMIGELTLAIRTRQKVGALAATIHPYPTKGEALRRAADAYTLARLTPLARGLLGRWFAWRR